MSVLSFRPGAAASDEPTPLPRAATLSEIFCDRPLDGAALGFALAALPPGLVLWLQDYQTRRDRGLSYLHGVGRDILRVDVQRPVDVLAGMEDGLRCVGLAAVLGEIWGNPAALSFTATRRLAMRAELSGIPCILIRHAAQADASAARQRWRVTALPSATHPDDRTAPGDPRWRAELFRARNARPGLWSVRHDRAAGRLDFAPLHDIPDTQPQDMTIRGRGLR